MKTILHRLPRLIAAIAGVLGLIGYASAEVRGWVWVDEEIPGEATDSGHEKWLAISSFSATGNDPLPGSSITLRRSIDKASPLLMKACVSGQVFPEVQLHVAQVLEGKPSLFWSLTLKDVRISSCKNAGENGSANTPLQEEVKIIPAGIRMTYYQLSEPSAPALVTILPYTGDVDGDGMSDEFETRFALLLHSDDGNLDLDGDGLTNLEESRLGTDPTKGSSFFKATAGPGPGGPNELVITWNSVPGGVYKVKYSPDLLLPFQEIATVTAIGETCSHPVVRGGALGFYKVEKVEP
ncbi:type VI secretion system tube protein Hcp [Luteolibacter luteus]|uniref:Type VI secretion system tube protein Hcp n=1 Tax=Luteolibacter luteus TaxID=2728835 RepID=A0A858RIS9_9BACT|nr:type VI secretion system tube protein Hcp [Luteolibacter luteus]QJE96742.1 type VI secretion system tube protein Hcp [Luteolibacter luteus]